MIDSVNHPTDQIYDFSKSETTPNHLIVKFWNVAVTKHRSTSGIVVVVGRTRLGEILTNSVGKVVQLTDRKFDSKTVQLVEKENTVNYDLDVFNEQIHQSVENAWNILNMLILVGGGRGLLRHFLPFRSCLIFCPAA